MTAAPPLQETTDHRPLPVEVECYAGYRGEQSPRRFRFRERWIAVAEVLDCWLAPDHRYFKVRGEGGDVYILRQDVPKLEWELTFYTARPGIPAGSGRVPCR